MPKFSLSNEYIRGLVDGEGCFTFCSIPTRNKEGQKFKLPAFVLRMHHRDHDLITAVRDALKLRNKIYVCKPSTKDGYNRGNMSSIIVRDLGSLKNVIVPFFYKRLRGYKAIQFLNWIDRIGSDPVIPENYKIIYRLYNCGYWDKNQKFLD